MGAAFPQLHERAGRIAEVLKQEEERFAETLDQGLKIFESAVANLSGTTIPGDVAFKLNDTYGFPVDLTADIARERGLAIDMQAYEAAMNAQREQSRAASHFANVDTSHAIAGEALSALGTAQTFTGYEHVTETVRVAGLFQEGQAVNQVAAGAGAVVVLESTPFYAESGGQAGDKGEIFFPGGARFRVDDVQKRASDVFAHVGELVQGDLHLAGVGLGVGINRHIRRTEEADHRHAPIRSEQRRRANRGAGAFGEVARHVVGHRGTVAVERLRTIAPDERQVRRKLRLLELAARLGVDEVTGSHVRLGVGVGAGRLQIDDVRPCRGQAVGAADDGANAGDVAQTLDFCTCTSAVNALEFEQNGSAGNEVVADHVFQ